MVPELLHPKTVKVGIKPVFSRFIHAHGHEGPCRVGEDLPYGNQERAEAEEAFKAFKKQCSTIFGGAMPTVLEPIFVEMTHQGNVRDF